MSAEFSNISPIHIRKYSKNPFHFIQEFFSHQNNTCKQQVDLESTEEGYLIKTDLAGYEKSDLHIHLNENILTIKGEKKKNKEEYYYKKNYESFNSSIYLPEKITENDNVNATFEEGMLIVNFKINPNVKRYTNEIKIN